MHNTRILKLKQPNGNSAVTDLFTPVLFYSVKMPSMKKAWWEGSHYLYIGPETLITD